MKKSILLSSLLVLSIVGCTSPILNNTSQYSDLDKEYSQFKTQALTQSYLKKKMDKWLSDSKYSKNLVREIEYAKFKHKDLLKDIVALQPTMFNSITGNTGVSQKRSEPSFENYIEYIDPFPHGITATSATSITSTSFTANWNSVSNATGYKLYIDGTPITLGNVTIYNVTGLVDASSHSYYVKATNSAGDSSVSNTINLTLLSNAPIATSATNIQQTQFTANWNGVGGATGYKLYIDGVEIDLGHVTSYTKTGLTKGTPHYYYVKATLNTGDTPISNIINLYTISDEFHVNTYTDNEQSVSNMAMADDGSFVITWQSFIAYDGNWRIQAQRYNSDGSPNGSEFRVNSYGGGGQMSPSIAMNGLTRNFVITWSGKGQGDTNGIFAQRYNSDGSPNGSEFRVNSFTTNGQNYQSVAMADDGKFVISWMSVGQDGDSTSNYNIYAQKYNADGTTNGGEFRVNSWTTNNQEYPAVAIADNGKFVISWMSYGQDGDSISDTNIYAQKYNADGTTNGSEFRVNSWTTNNQYYQKMAIADDGRFVIAWTGYGQNGDSTAYANIYAQKYDTDGSKNGEEFKVNTYTIGSQSVSSVGMSDDGRFIVTWNSTGQDSDESYNQNTYAKRYNSDGSVNGSEFRANTQIYGHQMGASSGMANNGYFVISWYGAGLGETGIGNAGYGIYAKRFDSNGNVL